jgi:hypothetical protein
VRLDGSSREWREERPILESSALSGNDFGRRTTERPLLSQSHPGSIIIIKEGVN